ALDTSFNGTGKVTTPIGSNDDVAQSVAVQSDGKIVVAGYSSNGSSHDFAVVRYTSTGALDTSFNGTGKVTTPIGSTDDIGQSVAVQSDGKILVAGYSWNGTNHDIALVRYTSAGALDTSFNGTGKVTTPIGGGDDVGRNVVVQSDGAIVVAGYTNNGSNYDFVVVRYTGAGVIDTTFNGTGKVVTDIGGNDDLASGMVLQSDGKIVVSGYSATSNALLFAAVRYTTTGALDAGFNGSGKVTTQIGGFDSGLSVAMQTDGKILVGGYSWNGSDHDFALVRYTSAGALDTNFNGTGYVATPIGSGGDIGRCVALQTDGKIVLAGFAANGSGSDFALARYSVAPSSVGVPALPAWWMQPLIAIALVLLAMARLARHPVRIGSSL
ncbi:MAG: delta-60 repeat domain-containing protein, partial [Chthoniobacteraceae bacterium]